LGVPRFLVDILPPPGPFTLDGEEGRHAATVRRLRPAEELELCDGRGGAAGAVVTAVRAGALAVEVRDGSYEPRSDPAIVVVQGIAKGDRSELAVQAMTEVGVDGVVPWAASRSVVVWRGERAGRGRQRWLSAAREATKQSRRAWLPEIAPVEATAGVAARLRAAAAAFVLHEEALAPLTGVDLPASGDVLLVVGPEGGIAPDEVAAFTAAGGVPVRLGPTVLRTSTAGVAALAVLSARLSRW
jgi:16S rRNA (uracil1498-N3)-methyltransferase